MDKRNLRQMVQTHQKQNSRENMRHINKRHQTLRPTPLLRYHDIPQNQRHPIRQTTNGTPQNRNNPNLHATPTIRQRRPIHMQSGYQHQRGHRTYRIRIRICN